MRRILLYAISKWLLITWVVILTLAAQIGTEALVHASGETMLPVEQQSAVAVKGYNPLRTPDTSSPRDTLMSFLTESEIMVEGLMEGTIRTNRQQYHAYTNLISLLDFNTTADGHFRPVINERIVMLYEVLSRVNMPPLEQIPGDNEIAEKELHDWRIPGTKITLERHREGSRNGEFLFSASTVQQIPLYYDLVKELPVQSGFVTGVYERYINSLKVDSKHLGLLRDRLKPVETESPQSVIQGLMENVNAAYSLVMETEAAIGSKPPTMSIEEAREVEHEANQFLERAAATLDLSQTAKSTKQDLGLETVLLLKEIIDRIGLPPLDMIPDSNMIDSERQRRGDSFSGPIRWKYPGTNIEIVEIMEGGRQGQFLFSSESVATIKEFYETIKDLPYQPDYSGLVTEYQSPARSIGFYDYYITSPGYLIPSVSYLGQFVERLPDGLKTMYSGQTVWQWLALFVIAALAVLGLLIFWRLLFPINIDRPEANQMWRRVVFNLVVVAILLYLRDFLDLQINITGQPLAIINAVMGTMSWALIATAVFFFGKGLAESMINSPKIDPESLKASYLHATLGIVSFVAMVLVFTYGLSQVGVSLIPLVAGLSVGSLAVALAVRPTLENIIGSFIIFIDKPFRVGHRVNVLGQNGTIESIGLRSTRIRLLTGHQTSIPNCKIVDQEIENIGRRPFIRRRFNVTITYDTAPDMIVHAVELLRDIVSVPETERGNDDSPHPNEAINIDEYPPRVYFNDLNADSLNLVVFYWYHPADYWGYLEHANWINLRIMERFNEEGIDFAFPTQTLHLAGDEKRPLTVGQKWESEEETFSPSAILAQAAALGAQVARQPEVSASDSMRPDTETRDESRATAAGELTDAPLEDDLLHEGNADDENGNQ